MPERVTPIPARDLIKVFKQFGFMVARQNGSHIQMTKPGSRTIVIQESNSVPIFHILANIKTAGITREEYLQALKEI